MLELEFQNFVMQNKESKKNHKDVIEEDNSEDEAQALQGEDQAIQNEQNEDSSPELQIQFYRQPRNHEPPIETRPPRMNYLEPQVEREIQDRQIPRIQVILPGDSSSSSFIIPSHSNSSLFWTSTQLSNPTISPLDAFIQMVSDAILRSNIINVHYIINHFELQWPVPVTLAEFDSTMNDMPLLNTHNDALERNGSFLYNSNPDNIMAMLVTANLYLSFRGQLFEEEDLMRDLNLLESFMDRNPNRVFTERWREMAERFEQRFYLLRRAIIRYYKRSISLFEDIVEERAQDEVLRECEELREEIWTSNIPDQFIAIYHIYTILDRLTFQPELLICTMLLVMILMMCFFDETSDHRILPHHN